MLTTLPIYATAANIADQAVAAIQEAFPTLEARHTNNGAADPVFVEVRNPLNGDCWTRVASIDTHERYTSHLQVGIGTDLYRPTAQFTSTPKDKKPLDAALICRTVVEYITMERARQQKQVAAVQTRKASAEAARRLNQKLHSEGLPTGLTKQPYLYFGVNRSESGNITYADVPATTIAVTFDIGNAILTPEMAEQLIELWKPIGDLLLDTPTLRDNSDNCPSTGTLVN